MKGNTENIMYQLNKALDNVLNKITMYRLVLYVLVTTLIAALIISLFNDFFFSTGALVLSTLVLIVVCFIANKALAIVTDADANTESWLITALILVCILQPQSSVHGLSLIALGGLFAMVGKYLVVYKHRHIFNPAALAAVILTVSKLLPAVWWVGNPHLFIISAIVGFLILKKIRHFQIFFSFLFFSLILGIIVGLGQHSGVGMILKNIFESSPLIFLGTIMLTEPMTMPGRRFEQLIYAAIVGLVFTSQISLGRVSATPEMALIVGNIFAFIFSSKYKLKLKFKSARKLSPDIYSFTFASDQPVDFKPGQYMEWTLSHKADSRGNRRTFSIASAPGQNEVELVTKINDKASSFKKRMLELKNTDSISVGRLSGDFTLPSDTSRRLVFIAGGIGVTPYLSMLEDLIKRGEKRDITMFYLVSGEADYCFSRTLIEATELGIKVIPVLTRDKPSKLWKGLTGRLTTEILKAEVPNYTEPLYYISGPNALVLAYKEMLKTTGVNSRSIVTDYFSGY
jgi:ferredoxin-NADP reductase